MVSFEKNVCILLESVEIVVMELHFCKVVCYTDILFKQIVLRWGKTEKGVQKKVRICWNSFFRNIREIWLESCYGHSIFLLLSIDGQVKHSCFSFLNIKKRKWTKCSLGYNSVAFWDVIIVKFLLQVSTTF